MSSFFFEFLRILICNAFLKPENYEVFCFGFSCSVFAFFRDVFKTDIHGSSSFQRMTAPASLRMWANTEAHAMDRCRK